MDPEASVVETEVVSEVDLCPKGPQPVSTVCNTPRQEAQVAGIQKENQYPQCSNLTSNNNNNNKPSGDRYNTWKRHVVS